MKEAYTNFRTSLIKGLEFFLILAFAVLLLDVLWGVFSRYVLGEQSRWTEELAIYALVWVSLIGAALAYEEHGHLGVDSLVRLLHPHVRKLSALIVEANVFLFSMILLWGGWILMIRTLQADQVSPALGWKIGYFYAAAPLSGFFFAVFSLEHFLKLLHQESDLTDESTMGKANH